MSQVPSRSGCDQLLVVTDSLQVHAEHQRLEKQALRTLFQSCHTGMCNTFSLELHKASCHSCLLKDKK